MRAYSRDALRRDPEDIGMGAWGAAYQQLRHESPSRDAIDFCEGAEWGAGWAFAIIGMAQAIRVGRFCEICGYDMKDKVSDGPWVCRYCGEG